MKQVDRRIVTLRHSGSTYVEIGREVHKGYSYIKDVLRANCPELLAANLRGERDKKIISLREDRFSSYSEISKEVGVSRSTVARVVHRLRLDLRNIDLVSGLHKVPQEQVDEIVRLREENSTYAKIKDETGVEYHMASAVVKEHIPHLCGWQSNPMVHAKDLEIAALKEQGLSNGDIVGVLGVNKFRVTNAFRRVAPQYLRHKVSNAEAKKRAEKIISLHKKDLTSVEIGERLDVSDGYVRAVIRRGL